MPKSIFDLGEKVINRDDSNVKVIWIYSEFIQYSDGSIKAGRHFNGVKNQRTEKGKKQFVSMPKLQVDDEVLL